MSKPVVASDLQKFIKLALKNLEGEWLLLGGMVLPALGVDHRVTMDIDFVGLSRKERSQSLELMKLTEKLGLPVESINQAADVFLDRIEGFRSRLVLLAEAKNCKIFRPDASLYLVLKIGRMSESDFSDCVEWLRLCNRAKEKIDIKWVNSHLNSAIKKLGGDSRARADRLRALSELFK